jgi:hypothetical protein
VLFHFISPNQPMDRHSRLLETSICFYHAVMILVSTQDHSTWSCWCSINTWLRDAWSFVWFSDDQPACAALSCCILGQHLNKLLEVGSSLSPASVVSNFLLM